MPARFAAKNRDATPSIKSSIFPCFASNSSTALLLQPISRPISAAAPGLLRIDRRGVPSNAKIAPTSRNAAISVADACFWLTSTRSFRSEPCSHPRASVVVARGIWVLAKTSGWSERKGECIRRGCSHVAVSSLLAARGAAASVESSRAHVATLEGWRGRRRRWVGYCRRTGSPHVRTALRQRRERVTTLWSCS